MDDAAVVARLRARDEATFRELVEELTPVMTRVARNHVSTDASAAEVVQDAWLGVLRGIDAFEGRSSVRTWVFRILTNIAKTRGTRERRAVPLSSLGAGPTVDPDRFRGADDDYPGGWKAFPTPWPSPEESAVLAVTTAVVAETIDRLPPRQRLVITMRDVHGFTADEVCAALTVTAGNQRVLLHRARAAVRAALEVLNAEGPAA